MNNPPKTWQKRFCEKFDKIINKYKKDGSYFDLVDGYIPLETFLKAFISSEKESDKQEMVEEILEKAPKDMKMLDKDLNSVWTVNEVRRTTNKVNKEWRDLISELKNKRG